MSIRIFNGSHGYFLTLSCAHSLWEHSLHTRQRRRRCFNGSEWWKKGNLMCRHSIKAALGEQTGGRMRRRMRKTRRRREYVRTKFHRFRIQESRWAKWIIFKLTVLSSGSVCRSYFPTLLKFNSPSTRDSSQSSKSHSPSLIHFTQLFCESWIFTTKMNEWTFVDNKPNSEYFERRRSCGKVVEREWRENWIILCE